MRSYGTVKSTFWTGASGRALRGKQCPQVLALYLMTCGTASMTGIYYLPVVIMAHESGLLVPDVEAALVVLAAPEVDLAHYDHVAELVWVPGMAEHQVGATLKPGDRRRSVIVSELERYRKHRFVTMFYDRYAVPYGLVDLPPRSDGPLYAPTHGASHGGYHGAPAQARATRDQDQEQEQDQEQDHGGIPAPTTAKRRGGRAPRTVIPVNWTPSPEVLAELRAKGLDADAVVTDFVGFWRNDGKLGADWPAAFRNNIAKILRTDFLRERFALAAVPDAPGPAAPPPATDLAPPAPAPPGLLDRIDALTRSRQPALLRNGQPSGSKSGPPSHDVAPGSVFGTDMGSGDHQTSAGQPGPSSGQEKPST